MITDNPKQEKYLGVLLEYDDNSKKWENTIKSSIPTKGVVKKDQIQLGLIGAGNFARVTMLPIMKSTGVYHFKGLSTTGGIGSAQANEVFNFEYTTNDYRHLLEDKDIDLIGISTQHNSHAKFVIEALEARKNVYCEKPLCLTLEELNRIEELQEKANCQLFCGLNRRHAPLIAEIKQELNTSIVPAVYDYIANAGFIPENHWTQDEARGGG